MIMKLLQQVESFDSYYGNSLRPAVAKSHSFGGYTAATGGAVDPGDASSLVRGDSAPTGAIVHHRTRFLPKQDSTSSSISISRSPHHNITRLTLIQFTLIRLTLIQFTFLENKSILLYYQLTVFLS